MTDQLARLIFWMVLAVAAIAEIPRARRFWARVTLRTPAHRSVWSAIRKELSHAR